MRNGNNTILTVKNLHKDFSGLKILSGVELEVKEGERHAVIGPNGAGKTTFFNLITGKLKPSAGEIYYRNILISGRPPHVINQMGISRSFQITNIFKNLTVIDNVRSGVRSRLGLKYNFLKRPERQADINSKTEEILESVGLSDVRNRLAGSLSYGQQRALEIALALSTDPELILLDEPTAGMTREETTKIVELIERVSRGKTLLIIEHDMDVVFSLADTISVLHHGSILVTGKPEEIRNDQRVKDAYLGGD